MMAIGNCFLSTLYPNIIDARSQVMSENMNESLEGICILSLVKMNGGCGQRAKGLSTVVASTTSVLLNSGNTLPIYYT